MKPVAQVNLAILWGEGKIFSPNQSKKSLKQLLVIKATEPLELFVRAVHLPVEPQGLLVTFGHAYELDGTAPIGDLPIAESEDQTEQLAAPTQVIFLHLDF